LLAEWLKKNRLADAETLRAVENELSTEMKSAVTFALETKYPEPDEVNQHVYA
jgi:TPP-dependent pyruvate/acetoin dehydrogenase alpha subunit